MSFKEGKNGRILKVLYILEEILHKLKDRIEMEYQDALIVIFRDLSIFSRVI